MKRSVLGGLLAVGLLIGGARAQSLEPELGFTSLFLTAGVQVGLRAELLELGGWSLALRPRAQLGYGASSGLSWDVGADALLETPRLGEWGQLYGGPSLGYGAVEAGDALPFVPARAAQGTALGWTLGWVADPLWGRQAFFDLTHRTPLDGGDYSYTRVTFGQRFRL